MTAEEARRSVAHMYLFSLLFGAAGFVWFCYSRNLRFAAAFALGSLASLANLWFIDWLTRSIAPGPKLRKPPQAGAYVARSLTLVCVGYAIVKGLNISALAVALGLLSSTAAVTVWLIVQLVAAARGRS